MEARATNQGVPSGHPRALYAFLDALRSLDGVEGFSCGSFEHDGNIYPLPRFTIQDATNPDPIRIGIFAAIHGDEPAGALAAAAFLREASQNRFLIESYRVDVYPICNPTGWEDNTRHSRRGLDLNREFWKGSVEREVQILEFELRTRQFQGLIQLHADDTSEGVYGFVRGHTLTEHLLRPALRAAGEILPRNVNATIDGFAARDGIIYDQYEGILAAPAAMQPMPFEIVLETPCQAPLDRQVNALVVAIRTILVEYRQIVAFAANI